MKPGLITILGIISGDESVVFMQETRIFISTDKTGSTNPNNQIKKGWDDKEKTD